MTHRNAPERLHALGDFVDQVVLRVGMFVKQQMKLVEGCAAHQPVVLLVQGLENLRVGENPVQPLAGLESRVARESPSGKWRTVPNCWISTQCWCNHG